MSEADDKTTAEPTADRRAEREDDASRALASALGGTFRILRWLIFLSFAGYLVRSSVFTVPQHEVAFVLRFGKVTERDGARVLGPGVHLACPYPVEEVVRVPTTRLRTIRSDTFWYADRKQGVLEMPLDPWLRPGRDGYMLTGDANILHAKWALEYTVEDPEAWRFRMHDMDRLLHNELDHAAVAVCASTPVDCAHRTEVERFRRGVEAMLRNRCEMLQLGVRIKSVYLLEPSAPRQVRAAFDAVVQAEQERSEKINKARTYAARRVNEAQGRKARLVADAEVYRNRLVREISADAAYFTQIYAKFAAQPEIITQTLLQDTLRRVLAGVDQKYVVRRDPDGKQELRILVSPEKPKPWAEKPRTRSLEPEETPGESGEEKAWKDTVFEY
ncbi:MAG: protease modulator HflK [Kiritimatiellae bacterium]|nr:protease modulator HflK [Kiritimatiellia bacterium]